MSKLKSTDVTDNNDSVQQASTVSKRRNFLKKASVGAAIVTIPSHSAWAGRLISGNMSGNVSGWAQEQKLAILSHGFYKKESKGKGESHQGYGQDTLFKDAFGGEPIDSSYTHLFPKGLTLLDVMKNEEVKLESGTEKERTGGPSNVNMQLAAMYLNAFNHDKVVKNTLIHWPVVDKLNGPFTSFFAYGSYLYTLALAKPHEVGSALGQIINTHHADTETNESYDI